MMFRSLASSSSGNSYVLDDGRTRLLIEAGLPFPKLQRLLDYGVPSSCIISHSHGDHSKAAQELARRGVDVWCSADTAIACRLTAAHITGAGAVAGIGSYIILPFDCVHDVPCLGYLIQSTATGEKLLFATDTQYLPNRFAGLTQIAVECNHSRELLMASDIPDSEKKRIMDTHMSIETFIGFLRANDLNKVKCIHLLHMSDSRGDAEDFKRQVQEESGCMVEVC
jgi:phosphoribosyl 1,2-cyclic phosphodiesterase